jgi:hypothetical protein
VRTKRESFFHAVSSCCFERRRSGQRRQQHSGTDEAGRDIERRIQATELGHTLGHFWTFFLGHMQTHSGRGDIARTLETRSIRKYITRAGDLTGDTARLDDELHSSLFFISLPLFPPDFSFFFFVSISALLYSTMPLATFSRSLLLSILPPRRRKNSGAIFSMAHCRFPTRQTPFLLLFFLISFCLWVTCGWSHGLDSR